MHKKNKAFTLIELAISVIIIGVLIGGVLETQGMIKQSKIRRVINDVNNYVTAIKTFKLAYGSIPGDLLNATSYWPSAAANGNGNGIVDTGGEIFVSWQHLALAGLISGTYNGTSQEPSGPTKLASTKFNSRFEAEYWVIYGVPSYSLNNINLYPTTGLFAPLDLFYIDKKMDDGVPSTGWVQSWSSNPSPTCIFGTDNATGQIYSYTSFPTFYNLSATPACERIMFMLNDL